MTILVTYASKHGATQQIAERIAETLQRAGHAVTIQPVGAVDDPSDYAAVVLGSALYFGSWLKEAAAFTRRHRAALASRPVWLFSSGPLGPATTDAAGPDPREAAEPKELAELMGAIAPRDHRVFFGALDHGTFGLGERLLYALPAARALLIDGDFRDWQEIETWAASIAAQLEPAAAPAADAPAAAAS